MGKIAGSFPYTSSSETKNTMKHGSKNAKSYTVCDYFVLPFAKQSLI